MEDQVPFKVYTFWKDGAKPEVRRFGVDRNVVSSYTYLLAKIHDVFPKLKGKAFSVSWQDEEGDDVKVSSDEELMTMLTAAPAPLFKLFVHVEHNNETEDEHVINVEISTPRVVPSPLGYVQPGLHAGVVCDGCSRDVIGFRYKCITCDDFDLCSSCESLGTHSDHCFVRIPSPQMSLQVVRDSIKKSRYFLKSFAATLYEAQKKHRAEMKRTSCGASTSAGPTVPPHCSAKLDPKLEAKMAAKERREERREERQEKHRERTEKRQERREEERRERRDNPHERVSWMDIFSKYVDQFANLAADHIRVASNDAEQTPQTADGAQPNPYIDPTEFAKMMNACMNIREGCPFAEAFGPESQGASQESANESSASSTSQTAQVPNQAATAPEVPTQAAATPQVPITPQVSTQVPITPQASFQVPLTPQLVNQVPITPQVVPNPAKPVEESKADKSDAASVSSRDASPDKSAEGWTMINSEKDLEGEASAPVQMDTNLPEEFQPRPGAPYGFIYPTLNASTAVYNPQEPAAAPTQTAPTQAPPTAQSQLNYVYGANQPQAQGVPLAKPAQAAPAAAKPSAPVVEERQHRVPHIDAAIRQMLAMGFTNEGGWLTQLVESKDGNIAAVLDLLTPVNPQRK